MNLRQLVDQFRREVDDTAQNYLWHDQEVIGYAVEAENEACRRASLLVDSRTPEICTISIVAGEARYPIDPRILRILRATVAGQSRPLLPLTSDEMDADVAAWETHSGRVEGFLTDTDSGYLRTYRIPAAAGTLSLKVKRLPLLDLSAWEQSPEIPSHLHIKLIAWMRFRAFSKPDSDARDDRLAAEGLAAFEAEFGPPENAWAETFNARHGAVHAVDGTY